MGHSASKEIPTPYEGTPASYMYRRYGPHACQFLKKWNRYTESYPLKKFPLEGTFEMDKIDHLRRILQRRGRKVPLNQWLTYFAWYEETSTRLWQSEIRSVRDSQEKLQAEIKELKREVSLDRKERLHSAQVMPSLGSEGKVRDDPAHSSDAATACLPEVQENPSTSGPLRSAPDHPPRAEVQENPSTSRSRRSAPDPPPRAEVQENPSTSGPLHSPPDHPPRVEVQENPSTLRPLHSAPDHPPRVEVQENPSTSRPRRSAPDHPPKVEVQENPSMSRPCRSAPDHPPRVEEAEQSRPAEQLGAQPKADVPLMLAPTPDVGSAPAQPPWTPTELYQLALRLLDAKEDPEKFKEQLRIVLACFKPTWPQAQQLLGALLDRDVQKRLFEEANWPTEDPGWSEQELADPHRRLLEAVSKVCPRKCDWSKIKACQQKKGEEPADYMERLLEMTRRYIGFDQPADSVEYLVSGWFVEGLNPEVKNRLKQVSPGWRAQTLRELLDLANSCSAKKQRREESLEREFMALRLQELRATVHGRGRGRMVEGRRGYGAFHAVHTENYYAIDYGSG